MFDGKWITVTIVAIIHHNDVNSYAHTVNCMTTHTHTHTHIQELHWKTDTSKVSPAKLVTDMLQGVYSSQGRHWRYYHIEWQVLNCYWHTSHMDILDKYFLAFFAEVLYTLHTLWIPTFLIYLNIESYIAISAGILIGSRYNGDTKITTTNTLIHTGCLLSYVSSLNLYHLLPHLQSAT